MKYMLAICAATIMLAVLETCGEKPERAAFTVRPVQPDTIIDATGVYSDEKEQREMFGHTGAEAYEMLLTKKSKSDTVVLPFEGFKSMWGDSWFMRVDTLGNITIAYDSSASYLDSRNLKVNLVNGRWEVESALPVRIKLKDGYLENNGDSIAMGFEYGDIAKDFDALVEEVKAKKRRGESWFIGSPLTPKQYSYIMRMIEKMPDSLGYVPPKKKSTPKKLYEYPKDVFDSDTFQKAEQTLIKYYRFRGFKVETEWSHTVQCSVLVKWSKAEGDSIIVYESPNPDSYPKQKNND